MKKFYSLFSVILLWLFFAPELSAAQYYLAGDFTSWASGKLELKQEGTSNLYKATADVKANQSFKMICVNNGNTYWWGRGNSDNEYTLKEGEPLQVWAPANGSSGASIKIGVTGKYVFTFNTSNNNISIAKAGVDPQPEPDPTPSVEMPEALYVVGNIDGASWDVTEGKAVSMTKGETSFTVADVTLKNGTAADVYFSFITKAAPVETADKDKWDVVNSSDRFGSETANATLVDGSAKVVKYAVNVNASAATSWKVPAGVYTLTVDFKTMTLTAVKTGEVTPEPAPEPEPTPGVEVPAALYVVGDIDGAPWSAIEGGPVAMTLSGKTYKAENVVLKNGQNSDVYFTFTTSVAPAGTTGTAEQIWNLVSKTDRYGAETKDEALVDNAGKMVKYGAPFESLNAKSWATTRGIYTIVADFETMTVTATKTADIEPVTHDGRTIHFKGGWEGHHYAYVYKGGEELTGKWAGELMEDEGDGWYKLVLPATADATAEVIFSTGTAGTNRYPAEEDGGVALDFTGEEAWFLLKDAKWYDSKPSEVTPEPEPEPTPAVEMPEALYVVGNIDGANWDVTEGKAVSMTKGETSFTVANVTLKNGAAADVYFSFITKVAPVATADKDKWDVVNSSDRFGSETANATLVDGSAKVVKYAANVNASAATSWKVPSGIYTLTVDFKTMTLTAEKTGEITPEPAPEPPAEDGPKLHFKNTWTTTGKLFVYAYNTAAVANAAPGVLTAGGATEHTGAWPGKEMTEGENGWFSAVLPATVDADTKVIFNDGENNQLPASGEAGISLGTIGAESWYDPAIGGWSETNPDEDPSAINNAQADSNNANRVVMNLQGVKVSGKASGWVIIVDGNETTKAYIK